MTKSGLLEQGAEHDCLRQSSGLDRATAILILSQIQPVKGVQHDRQIAAHQRGDYRSSEPLHIEGTVVGCVSLPDDRVTVGRNGRVLPNIAAREIAR
jgi:hypothetical protein